MDLCPPPSFDGLVSLGEAGGDGDRTAIGDVRSLGSIFQLAHVVHAAAFSPSGAPRTREMRREMLERFGQERSVALSTLLCLLSCLLSSVLRSTRHLV